MINSTVKFISFIEFKFRLVCILSLIFIYYIFFCKYHIFQTLKYSVNDDNAHITIALVFFKLFINNKDIYELMKYDVQKLKINLYTLLFLFPSKSSFITIL